MTSLRVWATSNGVVDTATTTNFDAAAAIGRATNIANGTTLTAGRLLSQLMQMRTVAEIAHLNALTQK